MRSTLGHGDEIEGRASTIGKRETAPVGRPAIKTAAALETCCRTRKAKTMATTESLLRRWEQRNKDDFESVGKARRLLVSHDQHRKTLEEKLRHAATEIESLKGQLELRPTEDELERECALRVAASDKVQTLENDIVRGVAAMSQLQMQVHQLQQQNGTSQSNEVVRRLRETNAVLEELIRFVEADNGQPPRKRRRKSQRIQEKQHQTKKPESFQSWQATFAVVSEQAEQRSIEEAEEKQSDAASTALTLTH